LPPVAKLAGVKPPPRVTVAIPTFNRARLLRETLTSVLSQSLRDFEVYVCDNASDDDTEQVVTSFDDRRLRYVANGRNIGTLANESRCLRLGIAPLVTLVHDDDLLLPGSLERRVVVLERHPEVGLVHSAFRIIGARGETILKRTTWADEPTDPIEGGSTFIRRSMTRGCRVAHSSAMLRRTTLDGLGFEDGFGRAADFVLWLKVALRSDVAYLPTADIALRIHGASSSAGENMLNEGVYLESHQQTLLLRDAMLMFLDDRGIGVDQRRLRRLAMARCRHVLLDDVRRSTLPERRPRQTTRLLREIVQLEPSLLRAPAAGRLIASSLAPERGRRGVRVLRQMLGWRTTRLPVAGY
jgi:glycosyltransferase involved in cell wall biosynthesis